MRGKLQIDEKGNLWCHSCEKYRDIRYFHKDINNSYRKFRSKTCTTCTKKRCHNIYIRKKGEEALNKILSNILSNARFRAKKNNLEFNLDIMFLKELFIKQEGKCAISGIELTYIIGSNKINTNISIDKINPNNGYTKDNVQLASVLYNTMKYNLTMDELYESCSIILKNRKENIND